MTYTTKLGKRFWLLLAAVLVAGVLLVSIGTPMRSRGNEKRQAFYRQYETMGGTFIKPAGLDNEFKTGRNLQVVGIILLLGSWYLLCVSVASKSDQYKFDADGNLVIGSMFGRKWQSPIARQDVLSVQNNVRERKFRLYYPLAGFITSAITSTAIEGRGLNDLTVLFLNKGGGTSKSRIKYLRNVKAPEGTASIGLVKEAVLTTNPEFAKKFQDFLG